MMLTKPLETTSFFAEFIHNIGNNQPDSLSSRNLSLHLGRLVNYFSSLKSHGFLGYLFFLIYTLDSSLCRQEALKLISQENPKDNLVSSFLNKASLTKNTKNIYKLIDEYFQLKSIRVKSYRKLTLTQDMKIFNIIRSRSINN